MPEHSYPEQKPDLQVHPVPAWTLSWPFRYFRRKTNADPYLKWVNIAIGWALIAAAVFDVLGSRGGFPGVMEGVSTVVLAIAYLMFPRNARNQYRRGYFDGRMQFWRGLREANVRGMNPSAWLQAELDRDVGSAVLGDDGP